jgi:3-methyladenine DNA glycosylase AlkD
MGDDRYYVQKAVGWVLRELSGADLDAATAFVEEHLDTLGSIAFARAVERLGAGERAVLRERRRGLRGSSTPR